MRLLFKSLAGRANGRGVTRKPGASLMDCSSFRQSEEWITDQLHDRPTPPGQPGSYCRSGSPILNETLLALLGNGLSELRPQALVVAGEVIISQPPEKMFAEFSGVVSSPCAGYLPHPSLIIRF